MKLKEKLAEQHAHKSLVGQSVSEVSEAYIAGFEKAREMALNLWQNGLTTISFDFMNLGEKDVEIND